MDEIRIEPHVRPREDLRRLFELAEDSPSELASYLHAGRVLVAVAGSGEVVGRNMAVRADQQRRGTGALLVRAAIELAAAESATVLLVATAADPGNLRFYQRQGFRMRSIERNAFGPHNGYPPGITIDGIPLRDRVWLDRPIPPAS